ncbi:gamma-glutamylcyclotransferase [Candidatus Poribacteria bacterium]|nr:gamma-glutamylcyclotransferase [Candidatus Poribacteria bacterium]
MLAGRAREIVTAETSGQLYDLPEGYPAFLRGAGVVVGDLVTVRESAMPGLLRELDRFEGYFGRGLAANIYAREVAPVTVRATGATCEAHVYIYADAYRARTLGRHLPTGDWAPGREDAVAGP